MDDHTPILIGAGQYTQRDTDPATAKDPLGLMVDVAGRAAEDAGQDARLLGGLDRIAVVSMLTCQYGNAPHFLAEQLGAHPAEELYTTSGGNVPQWLVNETAADIAAGRVRFALLAGAEALRTVTRARRAGVKLGWGSSDSGTSTKVIGDGRMPVGDQELKHGAAYAIQSFALLENALRAHYGLDLETHRQRLGELCSRFSAVAARNPHAWFRTERSAAEIATITPDNRLIGFPYPKLMNAIREVDMAAAVLMTSVGEARRRGIHPSRWVYLIGCADADELWFLSDRVNYHSSPALRLAGRKALEMAGIDLGQIDHFDLYSCFPCAVQIGRDMLGISADDPRPLTLTGGLPYHGGPGNNYVMHSIANTLHALRAGLSKTGLVSGLGLAATKHSVGVYSTEPRPRRWQREDPAAYQVEIDRLAHPRLAIEPRGRGEIETYTVMHERDGRPARGVIIGRLPDGRRFLANTPDDAQVLSRLTTCEAIGATGRVSSENGLNRFDPD